MSASINQVSPFPPITFLQPQHYHVITHSFASRQLRLLLSRFRPYNVLPVATQRSWKNAEDEWVSKGEWHRAVIFRPRQAESVLSTIKRGAHVLVEGELVSSTYERPNGKKSATTKITSWSVRADVVRKLDRGEPEPETVASGAAASSEALDASDPAPFERWSLKRVSVSEALFAFQRMCYGIAPQTPCGKDVWLRMRNVVRPTNSRHANS